MESHWPMARFSSSGPQVYCRTSSQPSRDIPAPALFLLQISYNLNEASLPSYQGSAPVISQLQYLLSDLVSCIPCLFCFLTPEGPLALMYQAVPALPALPIGFTPPQQPQSPEG
ncbi:hypothetical protein GHT09_003814 [Marmota monax]|uniref:Uncharacterized protein n=1 Tax=Marmota monax TaxID=9995 RepID=A0A834UNR0_MARMO|nr:hypothetical protein GHT09_003814 [Marmota monax]